MPNNPNGVYYKDNKHRVQVLRHTQAQPKSHAFTCLTYQKLVTPLSMVLQIHFWPCIWVIQQCDASVSREDSAASYFWLDAMSRCDQRPASSRKAKGLGQTRVTNNVGVGRTRKSLRRWDRCHVNMKMASHETICESITIYSHEMAGPTPTCISREVKNRQYDDTVLLTPASRGSRIVFATGRFPLLRE